MIRTLSILAVAAFALSACVSFNGGSPAPVEYRGDGPKGTMQPETRPVRSSPTPIMDDTPMPSQKAPAAANKPANTEGMSAQEKLDLEMLDDDPQQPSADYKPVQKQDLPAPPKDGKTQTLSEQEELDMLDEGPQGPAPVDLQPTVQSTPSPAVTSGAVAESMAQVVPTSERPGSIKVQKGDTLFSLSEKYQVALDPLIEVNGLQKPYHLKVGQTLKLPAPLHYRVRNGDTLYSIARKYGMDFQSLAMINGIDEPYAIAPNTILILPALVRDQSGGWKPAAPKPVASSSSSGSHTTARPVAKPVIRKPSSTSTFIWPIQGKILSSYGGKSGGMRNDGINIAAREGEEVHAAGSGTVIYAGSELKNYGMLILIRHPNGWVTAYAHNASAKVKEGAKVKAGDVIALAGSSGSVDTPQLHFETRKGVKPVNPLDHLPAKA